MNVVVARAVNQEQVAAQTFCEIYGGAVAIAFHVFKGQAHVTFLVNCVVETEIGHRRDGHAYFIEIGGTEH